MDKLQAAMCNNETLANVIFGDDREAAWQAANAIEPCDRTAFEEFCKAQAAKELSLRKVWEKACTNPETGKVIFGEDRKAAYEAAKRISGGYSFEEFDNLMTYYAVKALEAARKSGTLDDKKMSDEELDMIAGGAWSWKGFALCWGGAIGVVAGVVAAPVSLGSGLGISASGASMIVKGVYEFVK